MPPIREILASIIEPNDKIHPPMSNTYVYPRDDMCFEAKSPRGWDKAMRSCHCVGGGIDLSKSTRFGSLVFIATSFVNFGSKTVATNSSTIYPLNKPDFLFQLLHRVHSPIYFISSANSMVENQCPRWIFRLTERMGVGLRVSKSLSYFHFVFPPKSIIF